MAFNPVANNDVFTILSNAQLVTLNIGANDSDPDGSITAFDLDIATFKQDTSVSLTGVRNGSVAWADYNGDSKSDFLLTGMDDNDTSISRLYVNTGSGFSLDRSISLPGIRYGSVAWADYNGDSKPDLLLTGLDNNDTSISRLYVNTGSGFSLDRSVSLPGVQNSSVAWADYNGDGKPDFLLTGEDKNFTPISRLYVNTGSGFSLDRSISLPGVDVSSVAWADYNGDSKPDLLLTGRDNNFSSISQLYVNTGSGFSLDTLVSLPGVESSSVAWADYNGDSKPDFLVTGSSSIGYISHSSSSIEYIKISQLYLNTYSNAVETNITTSQGSFSVEENGQLLFTPISGLTDKTTLSYI